MRQRVALQRKREDAFDVHQPDPEPLRSRPFDAPEETPDQGGAAPAFSPAPQTTLESQPGHDFTTIAPFAAGPASAAVGAVPDVQRRSDDDAPAVAPALESSIAGLQGGGAPLPEAERAFFESRMGVDFAHVRLHTDVEAVDTAQALNARAFTVGQNIAFDAGEYQPGTDAGRELLAHELTHVVQQTGGAPQQVQRQTDAANATADVLPSAEELTERISRCIGIWETNRGQDEPAPQESTLDTVAGIRASMATIEQATMPYAITVLKGHPELWEKASPPLTLQELNDAEERCVAVRTLLNLVADAAAQGTTPDDFIASGADAISATGLSDEDVRTMFSAVALKATVDAARAEVAAGTKTLTQAAAGIPEGDRMGLGQGSLKAYIRNERNWGENRAAWQRKAVGEMPDNVGERIESVAVSDSGTGLVMAAVRDRVDSQLAQNPVPSEEQIVRAVAQRNNPNEADYGLHVWETYQRLYP